MKIDEKKSTRTSTMRFLAIVAALAGAAAAASALPNASDERLCNGHAELCDRSYSNVTFVGSHNTAFVGIGVADNQGVSVEQQLAMGVRLFETQTHRLWRRSDNALLLAEGGDDDELGEEEEDDEEGWQPGDDEEELEATSSSIDRDLMIRLCHTRCSIRSAGRLKHFLANMKTFLDANPNEVVTLMLTNNNGTDFPPYSLFLPSV